MDITRKLADQDRLYYYRVSGWLLSSDIALDYLIPADVAAQDIAISFKTYRHVPGEPIAIISGFRIFAPGLADFSTPDGFRARISNGNSIEVSVPPGMTNAEVQTLLFGRCLGMLSQQRGQPPLHACAVWLGLGAIAIAGNSGVGKSTIARALIHRGHDLLTDDQLILDADNALAQSCIPSNKLCLDAVDWLGEKVDPTQRVLPGVAKFHSPANGNFRNNPAPLCVIFLLAPKPSIEKPQSRRLSPSEVIANLSPVIVRRDVAATIGAYATHFRWLSKIAATIPVYSVFRSSSLRGLDQLIEELMKLSAIHGALDQQ